MTVVVAADRKDKVMLPLSSPWAADLKQLAANLLATPSALDSLSPEDAMVVVGYMEPQAIAAGDVFVQEGKVADADRLWLVLEGELSVQSHALQDGEAEMVMRVMGPGSLIGELSLLDGGPRSASCVADTDLLVATLSRHDLSHLLAENPEVGSRLLLAMAKRMAGHMRDLTRKLQLFAQINRTLGEALKPTTDATPVSDWPEVEEED